jgi:group I intron endonuclease
MITISTKEELTKERVAFLLAAEKDEATIVVPTELFTTAADLFELTLQDMCNIKRSGSTELVEVSEPKQFNDKVYKITLIVKSPVTTDYGTDSGIYSISFSGGKNVYIGQARNLSNRLWTHICTLRKNKHKNIKLQNAWNKYGESKFIFEVLEKTPIERLNEREGYYAEINKGNLYNLRQVGDYIPMSKETREKISKAVKGNKNCLGLKNALGYRHSEEAKKKISEAGKNKRYTAKLTIEDVLAIKTRLNIKLLNLLYVIL